MPKGSLSSGFPPLQERRGCRPPAAPLHGKGSDDSHRRNRTNPTFRELASFASIPPTFRVIAQSSEFLFGRTPLNSTKIGDYDH